MIATAVRTCSEPLRSALLLKSQHGLRKKSAADCFQVRALSRGRFIKKLGRLNAQELDRIKKAMALILDIEPEDCQL